MQTNQIESTNEIVGTRWYSKTSHLPNDSLFFISAHEVEYFMGELSWTFNSHYKFEGDTVTIWTIVAAFEMDDTIELEPDLIQKYILLGDSMKLVYLANRRGRNFVEADSNRYRLINDFVRIK
ncbi:MAG: hypothetical protein WA958_22095 [Tunicatimonas sp.]